MASGQTLFVTVLLLVFGIGSNPRGEKVQKDINVCENETAVLHCSTDGTQPTYRWVASGRRIPKKTEKYEQIQNGAVLLVKNVDSTDTARIRYISCQTHSKDMRRIVYLYKIMVNCKNTHPSVGSTISLPCKTGIPDDEIDYVKWSFIFKRHSKSEKLMLVKKDGKVTLAAALRFDGRISVQNNTLNISDIKIEDGGTYQCIVYRKNNLHPIRTMYHYNVNVTVSTTAKPVTTLSPSIGYTVLPNTSASNTKVLVQVTTVPTEGLRKTVKPSTMARSVKTATASSPIHPTQSSVPPTNLKSTTTMGIDNRNSSKTQKHDENNPKGLTSQTLSSWLLCLCSQYLLLSL